MSKDVCIIILLAKQKEKRLTKMEKKQFKTESQKLLDMMINSIYNTSGFVDLISPTRR